MGTSRLRTPPRARSLPRRGAPRRRRRRRGGRRPSRRPAGGSGCRGAAGGCSWRSRSGERAARGEACRDLLHRPPQRHRASELCLHPQVPEGSSRLRLGWPGVGSANRSPPAHRRGTGLFAGPSPIAFLLALGEGEETKGGNAGDRAGAPRPPSAASGHRATPVAAARDGPFLWGPAAMTSLGTPSQPSWGPSDEEFTLHTAAVSPAPPKELTPVPTVLFQTSSCHGPGYRADRWTGEARWDGPHRVCPSARLLAQPCPPSSVVPCAGREAPVCWEPRH